MNITVTAHRWEGGWELHHGDEPITQVSTLDRASEQVRDYLDTVQPDIDHSSWTITVTPELGTLGEEVAAARAATEAASEASIAAARQAREVVRHLRAAGLSVTDAAAVLGVSRGRISQLANA
ncbi:antitoxin HicB [Microbacterium sp. A93]|uniref:antitoxin HicB n=1 Tax=Microbacterium sp. A93 TaxID=3450716 RepID=UPI003F41CD02